MISKSIFDGSMLPCALGGGGGCVVFNLPWKYRLAKGCPKGLEHQYLLRQKLMPHGAEASFNYYSLCVSNCKVNNIHTSSQLHWDLSPPRSHSDKLSLPSVWRFKTKLGILSEEVATIYAPMVHAPELASPVTTPSGTHLFRLFQLPVFIKKW